MLSVTLFSLSWGNFQKGVSNKILHQNNMARMNAAKEKNHSVSFLNEIIGYLLHFIQINNRKNRVSAHDVLITKFEVHL